MGANNSTRRVSFESDENDNITVVKGIRLSENVIKRMKEPTAPPEQQHAPTPPPPAVPASVPRPVPPLFDPITSLPPPPPSFVEPVAPPAPPQSATETVAAPPPPPPVEKVTAPTIADIVPPSSCPAAAADAVVAPALEPVATPSLASAFAPADPLLPAPRPAPAVVEVVTPLAPPPLVAESSLPKTESTAFSLPLIEPVAPPHVTEPFTSPSVAEPISPPLPVKTESVTSPPLTESKPLSSTSVFESVNILPPQPAKPFVEPPLPEFNVPCKPVAPPPPPPPPQPAVEPVSPAPVLESNRVPPPSAAPAADEEALRKRIADELYKDLKQEKAKADQELQAWVEAEKARASAQAQAEAKSQVQGEVSRLLSAQQATVQESLHQAFIKERIATEDEKLRAQLLEIERKAKQLEAKEADLKTQDAFYRNQVARLEERSSQFYKVTSENFHKAADQVNAKFRRYDVYPVCADLQEQILMCYKENVGKTLHCSNIAARYLQCVNNAKQNKLKTGG